MFARFFKGKEQYLFSEAKNTACMACTHVLEGGAPVLYVSHDAEDGMWQFLCGADNHGPEHAKIIGLSEVVSLDPSLNELHEMPLGVGAERNSKDESWQPFRL